MGQVKMVNCFDQSDAAHLKQVVKVFAAVGKALDNAQNQPQVPVDELFPCFLISFCVFWSSSIFSFSFSTLSFAVFTPQISTLLISTSARSLLLVYLQTAALWQGAPEPFKL